MKIFNFFIICVPSALLRTGLCSVLWILFSSCATTPNVEDIKKAEVYYKLGFSYLSKDQLNEAFIEYQRAIKLNPKDKLSLNDLGYISARLKQYNEAISYYKRAISIDPNYSEAMNNLGVTYLEIEDWDEAIKYFKMALRNPLYTTPEKAYANLGYALYRKGEYADAINALKESSQRYPNYPQHFYVLGLVYMKLGNYEAAIDEFEKALNITPEYIDVHLELAHAYLKIGDKEEAFKHFKIVAESSGNNEKRKEALRYLKK